MQVGYREIEEARRRLEGIVHLTPLQRSRTFSGMTGGDVYMKLENLQRTGAFKIRGAYNKIAGLPDTVRRHGIVTASAGNHAQGVASAATAFGVSSVVVMPKQAPEAKIRATENYGARVLLCGDTYEEAYAAALAHAADTGGAFVHAFDDAEVIAGQGTIGLEIMDALPDVDQIVVPVGGGGLIAGIAAGVKAVNPQVRIVGIQPEGAASGVLSWHRGSLCIIERPVTVADGLAVRRPGELPFYHMLQLVDDMVTVSEQEIMMAMRLFLERAKLLVEGAGAAALAALVARPSLAAGRKSVVVVSGGNVDLMRLAALSHSSNRAGNA